MTLLLRRNVAAIGILAVCAGLFYQASLAAPAPADADKESLAVRCARAQLRLAELSLKKAQDMNRNVANTMAAATMAHFVDNVEYAKLQIQNASRTDGKGPYQACLERTEQNLRLAEGKLKKATETNQRSRGAVSPLDFERLQLSVEIARMQLQRGRELADASPDVRLQWQLEMIADEMARIREQTNLLGQNRLSQF